jgi:hypothetical protein
MADSKSRIFLKSTAFSHWRTFSEKRKAWIRGEEEKVELRKANGSRVCVM